MNKFVFLVGLLLSGCASYQFNVVPEDKQVDDKFPNMNLIFDGKDSSFFSQNCHTTFQFSVVPLASLFENEFQANVIEPSGVKRGSFELQTSIAMSENSAWGIPVGLTFGGLFLLGVPGDSFTGTASLKLSVKDINGNLIKNYYSTKEQTSYVAMFQYTINDATKRAYNESFKLALNDVTEQLLKNKNEIISKLLSTKKDVAYLKESNQVVKVVSSTKNDLKQVRPEIRANSSFPQWLNFYLSEGSVLQGDSKYKNYIGEGETIDKTYQSVQKQIENEYFSTNPSLAKTITCEKTAIKTYQDWTFGMYRCLKSDIEKARLKTK